MEKPKLLVTAGCSFSYHPADDKNTTWATFLDDYLKIKSLHLGHGGAGNITINRKLIYNITEVLKQYKPEEILVCIMWSFPERHETIISGKKPLLEFYENKNLANLSPYGLTSRFNRCHYLMNPNNEDELTKFYYKYYFDSIQAQIVTLENILMVQWFLKNLKINYYMMSVSETTLEAKLCSHPEINFLFKLLDTNNFLLSTNAIEFFTTISKYKELQWQNGHPVTLQHKDFCDNILIPNLKKLGYIE